VGRLGISIVAPDINGCIMAAKSTTKRIDVEPDVAEAIVTLHAIILIKKMAFRNVILKGCIAN
jgi:hypothetical protein